MAQLASINGSTANALPSSQIPPPVSDATNAAFLALLTQVSSAANDAAATDQSGTATTNGANAASTPSFNTVSLQLESQITKLLNSGVSLDAVTKAIATKLVALTGTKSGPDISAKVNAVAQYLRSGESTTQSSVTTAKSIVGKVKALVTALQQSNAGSNTNTDSGNILDALQAGETPTSTNAVTDAVPEENASAQTPPTQSVPVAVPAKKVVPPTQSTPHAQVQPTPDQSAFALALQALQNVPQTPTVPATSKVATPVVPVVAPAISQATNTQAATSAAASALLGTTQTTAPTATATVPQPSTPPPAVPTSNAQPTLGQLSVDSSLQVATDLSAIAAGQGTALSRALLRAANVDVARSAVPVGIVDATLSSLSASLENIFSSDASADGSDEKNSGQNAGASADASLSDSGLALSGTTSSVTNPTSFVTTLAKTQAPLDVDDIMDQVVHGLSIKNFSENPTVNISLNPPHLGELNVKLTVTDSTVNATVVTQSSDVKAILLDNRAQLDQTLAAAGLKLGSLNVDVSGQGLQQEADRRQSQRDQVFTPSLAAPQTDTPADGTAAPSAGPSMLGSVDLTLLNQLV